VLLPRQQAKLARGAKDKELAMSQKPNTEIAVIGIDIGKNSFHVVGHDARGAIVLRQKWSQHALLAWSSLLSHRLKSAQYARWG
jgi:transposase